MQAYVGLSGPHEEFLKAAGLPVPSLVRGTFLIDTGASVTCVDPGLVAPLNLAATGMTMIQTPSTNGAPHACHEYDVRLIVPSVDPQEAHLFIEAMPVLETTLRPQGIDGLIGRDILKKCILIYNGSDGHFALAY